MNYVMQAHHLSSCFYQISTLFFLFIFYFKAHHKSHSLQVFTDLPAFGICLFSEFIQHNVLPPPCYIYFQIIFLLQVKLHPIKIYTWKFSHLVPQNVSVFGDGDFRDVIKLKQSYQRERQFNLVSEEEIWIQHTKMPMHRGKMMLRTKQKAANEKALRRYPVLILDFQPTKQ